MLYNLFFVKFLLRCAHYSRGYTIILVSFYLHVLFKGAKCSSGHTVNLTLMGSFCFATQSLNSVHSLIHAQESIWSFDEILWILCFICTQFKHSMNPLIDSAIFDRFKKIVRPAGFMAKFHAQYAICINMNVQLCSWVHHKAILGLSKGSFWNILI